MEDLCEPSQICEMCEVQEIRYVHFMEHKDFPETLSVGCICAEHLEQDYLSAKRREMDLKNVSRQRTNWISQKSWASLEYSSENYAKLAAFDKMISLEKRLFEN